MNPGAPPIFHKLRSANRADKAAAPQTVPTMATRLNKEINAALADPEMEARLADLGAVPMPMTPAEFGKFIAAETEKWGKLIRAANIKAD